VKQSGAGRRSAKKIKKEKKKRKGSVRYCRAGEIRWESPVGVPNTRGENRSEERMGEGCLHYERTRGGKNSFQGLCQMEGSPQKGLRWGSGRLSGSSIALRKSLPRDTSILHGSPRAGFERTRGGGTGEECPEQFITDHLNLLLLVLNS